MSDRTDMKESVKGPVKNLTREIIGDIVYKIAKECTKRVLRELKKELKEKAFGRLQKRLDKISDSDKKLEKQLNESIEHVLEETSKNSARDIDFAKSIEQAFCEGAKKSFTPLAKVLTTFQVIIITTSIIVVGGTASAVPYIIKDSVAPPDLVITEVLQEPTEPRPGEAVTVTAHITDEVTVTSVTLTYDNTTKVMSLVEGTAQDGYWHATIPGQPVDTTLWITITASDEGGNEAEPYSYSLQWVDTIRPRILGVTQEPDEPEQGDDVTVTAHVTDEVTVTSVTLTYDNTTKVMSLVEGTAQDGYWQATIPGQPVDTTLWITITASDEGDNEAEPYSYSLQWADTIRPRILGVTQEPDEPEQGDDVTVTAHVTDEVTVTSVTLTYDGTARVMSLVQETVQDGYWQATIPGQPVDTTLWITINASDEGGNEAEPHSYTTYWTARDEAPEAGYGGTLTVLHGYIATSDPPTADMTEGMWPTVYYATPVLDYLITGDIDQYGPRCTNEFAFRIPTFVPEEFCRGNLVESWEVTPDKIVFHIRPGVYWAGKEGVMESREYTAYDTEFSLIRYMESPAGQAMLAPYDWIKSIVTVDKYTCVVETNFFNANWKWLISTGWGNAQYAEEVVEAGASDWNNLVGTGPFMLKEYIPGSHFIYERNPDYWDKTTINGKEYVIPFVDELVYPIIPDESTRMAALRTGKLDYMTGVSLRYEDTLRATCPELIQTKITSVMTRLIVLRVNSEYLADKEIRRALMIGTDRATIAAALFTEAELYGWPLNPAFTPFDDLPAATQELFDYNPVKARDMIAAVYPDGINLLFLLSNDDPVGIEMAALVQGMWDDIGVTVELEQMEQVAAAKLTTERVGYDVMTRTHENWPPLIVLRAMFYPGQSVSVYDNDYYTALYDEAKGTTDMAARNEMFKELAFIGLDDVPYIDVGAPYQLLCWWPWVKNYYGELNESAWGNAHINARIWIDLNLKAKMGY